jgi:lysyl endopeptidase
MQAEGAYKPDNLPGEARVEKRRSVKASVPSQSVVLDAVPLQQLNSVRERSGKAGPFMPKAHQIGVARDLTALARESSMASALRWYATASQGSVAAISVTSPNAYQIRLGVLVQQLPVEAVLRVYAPKQLTQHEISAQEVLSTLAANRNAGDFSDEARTYWMPPTSGETITLEIELPKGVSPDQVRLSIPRLSHIFSKIDLETPKGLGDSSYCSQDISCAGSAYDEESAAVAQLSYVENGSSFSCTGTMLAAVDNSFTPYMLTANHCISTQTVASTLVSTFFFRSISCNDFFRPRPTASVRGGATLLYNAAPTDSAFMRLNSAVPAGVKFSGWTASNSPAIDSATLGVHHPAGDIQAYAIGRVDAYTTCTDFAADGSYSCQIASAQNARNYSVAAVLGITEGGSSGSGLWTTLNGKRYLVGQLRGGNARCTDSLGGTYRGMGQARYFGTETYGRFDLAYTAALSRWLGAAAPTVARAPVYRFYNATTGAHFYTQSAAERDYVIATLPLFKYENIAFYAYAAPIASLATPVYRFYNARTGAHFYTHSESERSSVQAGNKDFNYEGPTWNAQAGQGGLAVPVYRFYSATRGTHFYTISEAEKNNVIRTLPDFRLEGVVYYAWTTP